MFAQGKNSKVLIITHTKKGRYQCLDSRKTHSYKILTPLVKAKNKTKVDHAAGPNRNVNTHFISK